MKIKYWIFLKCIFLLLVSCTQREEIDQNKSIEKKIELHFNESAILTQETVTFNINDNFDFKNLILTINGEDINEETFTVKATQPVEEVFIKVSLKESAPSGNYDFSMTVADQSAGLADTIDFKGDKKGFKVTSFKKPKSILERLLFYGIIVLGILSIIALTFYILKRDNMPLGRKTFRRGSISFPNGEFPSIRLEGKYRYQIDLSELFGIDPGLTLHPVDKYEKNTKKRFARLKNYTDTENTLIYDGTQESMGSTEDLYHMDEIKIKTKDNRIILLHYMNNKNLRLN